MSDAFKLLVTAGAAALMLSAPGSAQHQSSPLLKREQAVQDTSPPAASQPATGTSNAPGQPVFLQGGIEHAERLAPVAPALCAGVVFNQQALPTLEPNNDWYWIPAWYAGQKHVDTDTILEDYDFKTGQTLHPNRVITNRQDLFIGFQADRNGQIWEFKRAPYTTTVEGNNFFEKMLVSVRDPISVSADKVVIRLVQTTIVVDRGSQRILKTEQQEQLNTYIPGAPGTMQLQTSIKSFDSTGSPLVQESSARVVTNRAPFQPVDYYQGRDMRALFRQYMTAHGYANLLPANSSSPLNVGGGSGAPAYPVASPSYPAQGPAYSTAGPR